MIFKKSEAQKMYELIAEWLCSKSVGGHARKSNFNRFQKELWNPLLEIINRLNKKEELTIEESEFINSTVYRGEIFRVLLYNPKARMYVCEVNEYQSWSKSIEGLSNVKGIHGNKLLLISKADIGIDIFGLLCFLIKHKYIYNPEQIYSFESIARYASEEEIAYKTSLDKIERAIVVNSKDLNEYDKKIIREIPREMLGRKNFD